MKNKEVTERVSAMAQPLCAAAGVTLWDVTFEKEGALWVLTIFIDRDEGVFIEDCEKISRALDPMLDAPEFDEMPPYTLSVSSAGLERRLTKAEHFAWAYGKKTEITFYKAKNGVSAALGVLESRTEKETVLIIGGEKNVFQNADIASAKLYFEN